MIICKILEDGSIETRNAKIYGTVYAYEGKIGGFTIDSGRLYWKAGDYFGNDSRSLKLGVSQTDMEVLWMCPLMPPRRDGSVSRP